MTDKEIESTFHGFILKIIHGERNRQIKNTIRTQKNLREENLENFKTYFKSYDDIENIDVFPIYFNSNIRYTIKNFTLWEILTNLNVDDLKIIIMYYFEEYTDNKIGTMQNVSLDIIHYKRKKILNSLRGKYYDKKKN